MWTGFIVPTGKEVAHFVLGGCYEEIFIVLADLCLSWCNRTVFDSSTLL